MEWIVDAQQDCGLGAMEGCCFIVRNNGFVTELDPLMELDTARLNWTQNAGIWLTLTVMVDEDRK